MRKKGGIMKFYKNRYVLIILLSVLCGCSPKVAETNSINHQKLVSHFQSDEEKIAKDAVWTAKDIFKVGILNDGTNRDGYAQYVCSVLDDYEFKGKGIWVQVIDIVQLTNGGKWVKLGEEICK
jgi:hypothetical protein